MSKKITTLISIFALFIFPIFVANAATTGTVSATVTVQNVAVTVTDGTVAFGTLTTSDTADTTLAALNDTQTATNAGNVTSDITIKGQNSANWTLAATVGVEDEYVHEFCKVDTGDCDGTPTWTALTTSYQTLKASLAASGTYDFDLKLSSPSSSTNFTSQSVDVTVQVAAS